MYLLDELTSNFYGVNDMPVTAAMVMGSVKVPLIFKYPYDYTLIMNGSTGAIDGAVVNLYVLITMNWPSMTSRLNVKFTVAPFADIIVGMYDPVKFVYV